MVAAGRRHAAMAAFVVLASFALVGSEATLPRHALGTDDACDAEAGSCAVSALQIDSIRRAPAAAVAAKEENEDSEQRQQQPEEDESDTNWVWSRSEMDRQQRMEKARSMPFMLDLYRTFAPRMVEHCVEWTAFFWPMMSFWSQEVLRRVEAMPADADAVSMEKLHKFAKNASYLMCDFWFDPRNGTEWSEPVTEYMQRVYSAPATDLDMPMLDGWFRNVKRMKKLWAADSCMFWADSLMCDLGIWSRERQGSKGRDGLCWDRVPAPEYGFTSFGASMMDDRKTAPESFDAYAREEYNECLEQPLDKADLQHHCPMFGHYHSGFLNVSSWGAGYPAGSSQYNQVLQCQAKLNIPASASTTSALVLRPWGGNITLMDPPEDERAVGIDFNFEIGKSIMDHVFEILRERDEWRKSRHYKNFKKAYTEQSEKVKAAKGEESP